MELQIINISLLASLTFVVNLVRQKGYKSNSFAALLTLFLLMIPVAFIAAKFNTSIDRTNKMSFIAFGKYYKRARLEMKLPRPTVNYVHNSTDDQNQTHYCRVIYDIISFTDVQYIPLKSYKYHQCKSG